MHLAYPSRCRGVLGLQDTQFFLKQELLSNLWREKHFFGSIVDLVVKILQIPEFTILDVQFFMVTNGLRINGWRFYLNSKIIHAILEILIIIQLLSNSTSEYIFC